MVLFKRKADMILKNKFKMFYQQYLRILKSES